MDEERNQQQPETIEENELEIEGESQIFPSDTFPVVYLRAYNTEGKVTQFIQNKIMFIHVGTQNGSRTCRKISQKKNETKLRSLHGSAKNRPKASIHVSRNWEGEVSSYIIMVRTKNEEKALAKA